MPNWPHRENVEFTEDPTRSENVPEDAEALLINHRAWALSSDRPWAHWKQLLWIPVTVYLIRLCLTEVIPEQFLPWIWAAVCFSFFGIAVFDYSQTRERLRAVLLIFAGPITMFCLTTVDQFASLFLFIISGVFLVILCEQMRQHVGEFMRANPKLPDRLAKSWDEVWFRRSAFDLLRRAVDEVFVRSKISGSDEFRAEFEERRRYFVNLVLVLAAFLAAFLFAALWPTRVFASMYAIIFLTASLALLGISSVFSYAKTYEIGIATAFRRIKQCFELWFNYNIEESEAPGLLRSSAGNASSRYHKYLGVATAFAITMLPAASYFPIPIKLTGFDPWIPYMDSPDRQAILSEMTLSERRFYDRLNESGRTRFLAGQQRQYSRQTKAAQLEWLAKSPEQWIAIGATRIRKNPEVFGFSVILVFFASSFLPLFGIASCILAVNGRVWLHFYASLENLETHKTDPKEAKSAWQSKVEKLRSTKTERASNQIYLGLNTHGNSPIFYSRDSLMEHVSIFGSSGCGKTSRSIAPIISQLTTVAGDKSQPKKKRCSIVVIDLKGERYLFEGARRDAEKLGIPFKWFTNVPKAPTFLFNPINQSHIQHQSPGQRVQTLINSLGLDYGQDYGRDFFTSESTDVLRKILEDRFSHGDEVQSFQQLLDWLDMYRDFPEKAQAIYDTKKQQDNAQALRNKIRQLAALKSISITDKDVSEGVVSESVVKNCIDAEDILSNPGVTYFYLRAADELRTMRDLGRMFAYSLLTAASNVDQQDRVPVYLVIDEFQDLISQDFTIFLTKARSAKIGLVLANQSYSQLKIGSMDLGPQLFENTNLKIFHTVDDNRFRKFVMERSGRIAESPILYQERELPNEEHSDEEKLEILDLRPGMRFNQNDLTKISSRPELCYLEIRQNKDFAQFDGLPIIARVDHHVTEREHNELADSKWPKLGAYPGTFVLNDTVAKQSGDSEPAEPDPHGEEPEVSAADRDDKSTAQSKLKMFTDPNYDQ